VGGCVHQEPAYLEGVTGTGMRRHLEELVVQSRILVRCVAISGWTV
jgi:hypothetical protein